MVPIAEIKAEGEPAADGGRGGGNEGRSGTVFITRSFHRQTLEPTHHRVSGLPSLLIWLDVPGVRFGKINLTKRMRKLVKLAGATWSHDVMRHSFCSMP